MPSIDTPEIDGSQKSAEYLDGQELVLDDPVHHKRIAFQRQSVMEEVHCNNTVGNYGRKQRTQKYPYLIRADGKIIPDNLHQYIAIQMK